jgi:coproporphyrinogen III oxidase
LGQGVKKAAKEFIQTCYNDFKKESDGYMYMKLDKMAKFRGKNKKVCL